MTTVCEFCNKEYKNISNLINHQKTAQFCIKIQKGVQNLELACDLCEKILSSKYRLDSHKLTCKVNKKKKYEDLINIIKQKDEELAQKDQEIKYKDYRIIELESKLEMSEKFQDCLTDIAKQPKIQTNQQINNKYINLSPLNLTPEYVKDKVEKNFTKNNFLEGQKGVAEFVFDNLLKDVNGKSKYICDDSSRHKYSYKTEDGEIKVDLRAKKLTDMIKNDIIKKSNDIISNEIKKTDDMLNYMGKILDINNMRTDDNGKFLSRLSILTQYTDDEEILNTVKELFENNDYIEEVEYIIEDDSEKECDNVISNFGKKLDERKKNRELAAENEKKEYDELKRKHELRKKIKL